MAGITVKTLRGLFRSYAQWQSDYEAYGLESITDADGIEWNLFDVAYLLDQLEALTPRQSQAIWLFLVEGKREDEVAEMMGILPTNPVGLYATAGIEKLIQMIEDGTLPRFYVPGGRDG